MPTYVIANLHKTQPGNGAGRYLAGLDATIEPFGGRFLVHGAPPEVLEGQWSGDTVILEFPNSEQARGWYASQAYLAIKRYRTEQYAGPVVLIGGVTPGHRSTDLLTETGE